MRANRPIGVPVAASSLGSIALATWEDFGISAHRALKQFVVFSVRELILLGADPVTYTHGFLLVGKK
jgi:hypothetical protein